MGLLQNKRGEVGFAGQENYATQNALISDMIADTHAGVIGAAEALLGQFERMLVAVALRYRDVASYDDAYQEACLAFWQAVQMYDETRGIPFAGYALRKVHGDVRTAMRRLWTYNGHMKYVEEDVMEGSDVWDGIEFQGSKRDAYGAVDERMTLCALLEQARLSPREYQCVIAILQGISLVKLAEAEGVSTETVRTWRKRALRKLREVIWGGRVAWGLH